MLKAAHHLKEFIDFQKTTLVIGDFNVCPRRKPTNDLSSFLSNQMFSQLVTLPTHIDGGTFSVYKNNAKEREPIKLKKMEKKDKK